MYMVFTTLFGSKTAKVTPGPDGVPLPPHHCLFSVGESMEVRLYFDISPDFDDFDNQDKLILHETDIFFNSDLSNTRHKNISVPFPKSVLNNGTFFAHAFLTRFGFSPNPSSPNYDATSTAVSTQSLIKYLPRPKANTKKNLIGGAEDALQVLTPTSANNDSVVEEIISFWKPTLVLHFVDDQTVYARGSIPKQIEEFLTLTPDGNYYPALVFDEFWLLRDQLIPLNESLPESSLEITFSPIGLFKWTIMMQMEQSWNFHSQLGLASGSETDELKQMLANTNPYLLALTFAVSLLHMIFDFLAFKNDIAFWNNRDSMAGLSVRSLFINAFAQTIIFLYLLDSETSYMILLSSGVGLLIDFWKISKAAKIRMDTSRWWFPIRFDDHQTYTQTATKEYDALAMQYLSYVLYPLVVGYAIYSLMYETHKSWYSWIINSLVGCIYTFGFIMMTPQLFINYKMKSVAHLPWRTFMYKALNTFIDDLFAFIIVMPTMHRLSCFRDDIIFFIFLYQRWIYPVDPNRANEYGQVQINQDPASETEAAALAISSSQPEGSVSVVSRAKKSKKAAATTEAVEPNATHRHKE
eukprot:gnl/Hemi2/3452_TR1199_c0_g1_i1.p1 gnl/Hemi2/3452_TR1199_c0_g1~~gnl/Hemi2/3452_TR1199_c0_g1_i1.p1  ORF type:complete len:634 (-),score=89.39 gnl/Hemi2/3452_TR1199_c0_g1_i1:91-1833(-)